jgi:hypothetical protein
MRIGRLSRAALVALPLAAFACATEPNFTYSDDTASDASTSGHEAGAQHPEASTPDSTTGDDGEVGMADDASDAGSAADDTGTGFASDGAVDAGLDAPAEVGCGSLLQVSNCGACGVACDTTTSVGPACSPTADAAACSYSSCSNGFADCDPSGVNANGCETPVTTPANCGGCGVACDTVHSVDAGCAFAGDAGACTYSSCLTGFADCDAAAPNANGCETPITTVANCGACGVTCNTANSVDAGCGPAGCTYQCAPGWSNCNTSAANVGGCECNTPVCCAATGAAPSGGGPGYGCATTHNTGVAGGTYADCLPVGTYTVGQAEAACAAYVQTLGLTPSSCQTGPYCQYVISGVTDTVDYNGVLYENPATHQGYVWIYSGSSGATTGYVYPDTTLCTSKSGSAQWN